MVVRREFKEEEVEIGGKTYRDCAFRQCQMVYDGQSVNLEDCELDGCNWSFVGPANNTLRIVAWLCDRSPEFREALGRQLGILDDEAADPEEERMAPPGPLH